MYKTGICPKYDYVFDVRFNKDVITLDDLNDSGKLNYSTLESLIDYKSVLGGHNIGSDVFLLLYRVLRIYIRIYILVHT
jgi:hypothetical protein